MNGQHYLSDITSRFREIERQCDRAIAQVPLDRRTERLDPESNSIANLMLHLSGNMISRWTDFLTTDGEKPDRDRDSEFEDPHGLSADDLDERWRRGWKSLFDGLAALSDEDLEKTVQIRSQPHTVVEAIDRQYGHAAYHCGQIVFLAKHLAGAEWQNLSIPRRRKS